MTIRVSQSGGFAGVPIELANIDTQTLPPARAHELEQMVRDTAFFQLPTEAGGRGGEPVGADNSLRYEITVENAGQRHTVSFADGDGGGDFEPNDLRGLVAAVTRQGV